MTATAPAFTPEVRQRTAALYQKLKHHIPEVEWTLTAPLIDAIQGLKTEKKALVLAHNYMTPEIFHGVADVVGDSLALAREAARVKAEIIVVCGVHFMAETVKILNPDAKVLIADLDAGCSLAESITPADVEALRSRYPGAPVVTYVNTSAAVKAVSDVCCTSGNALAVVESLDSDEVIFIPDQYLARNVARQTKKTIRFWEGSCMVHEIFTPADLQQMRKDYPGVAIMAHPECPPDVVHEADYAGSTAQMIRFVQEKRPRRVALITECSMSDNVAVQFPDVDFVRPCNLCPHMKKITLPKILATLENETPEVLVDPAYIEPARRAIERMLEVKAG
ncbi:MAG: quinolinate synthase NadA [Spirochaetales bacterium]|nr:quinolinate synthase NadA [Spirochaetales bacterium]